MIASGVSDQFAMVMLNSLAFLLHFAKETHSLMFRFRIRKAIASSRDTSAERDQEG